MAVLGISVKADKQPAGGRGDQAVGEYCQGKDLAECQVMFGEGLARVCATCPE